MVRKSVRPYSAVEAALAALDTKEKQLRKYFQPMSLKEKTALSHGRANELIQAKHRYADVLDWQDDTSTIMTVDVPAWRRDQVLATLRMPATASEAVASRVQAELHPGNTHTSYSKQRSTSAHCYKQASKPQSGNTGSSIRQSALSNAIAEASAKVLSRPLSPAPVTQQPVSALVHRFGAAQDPNAICAKRIVAYNMSPIARRQAAATYDVHTVTADQDCHSSARQQAHTLQRDDNTLHLGNVEAIVDRQATVRFGSCNSAKQPTAFDMADMIAQIPPAGANHPYQTAGASVLTPEAENQLFTAAISHSQGSYSQRGCGSSGDYMPHLDVALTPAAQLLYFGHVSSESDKRSTAAHKPRATSAPKSRKYSSPGHTRDLDQSPKISHSQCPINNGLTTRPRPWSCTVVERRSEANSSLVKHGECPTSTTQLVQGRELQGNMRRPLSARPASAQLSTRCTNVNSGSGVHVCSGHASYSKAKQRPWSAAACISMQCGKTNSRSGILSDGFITPVHHSENVVNNAPVQNSAEASRGPPEQHIRPRFYLDSHLAVITSKGQRQTRHIAKWAATAPMRPESAPCRLDTRQKHHKVTNTVHASDDITLREHDQARKELGIIEDVAEGEDDSDFDDELENVEQERGHSRQQATLHSENNRQNHDKAMAEKTYASTPAVPRLKNLAPKSPVDVRYNSMDSARQELWAALSPTSGLHMCYSRSVADNTQHSTMSGSEQGGMQANNNVRSGRKPGSQHAQAAGGLSGGLRTHTQAHELGYAQQLKYDEGYELEHDAEAEHHAPAHVTDWLADTTTHLSPTAQNEDSNQHRRSSLSNESISSRHAAATGRVNNSGSLGKRSSLNASTVTTKRAGLPIRTRGLRWEDTQGTEGKGENHGSQPRINTRRSTSFSSRRTANIRSPPAITPDDEEMYQVRATVQLGALKEAIAKSNLDAKTVDKALYNLYVTDLGRRGCKVAKRTCIARATAADRYQRLVVPQSRNSDSPQVEHHTVLPLAQVLPWVKQPRDLYQHWIRLEAYAVVPAPAKVLDAYIFMCAPEDDVPRQPPNIAEMKVVMHST